MLTKSEIENINQEKCDMQNRETAKRSKDECEKQFLNELIDYTIPKIIDFIDNANAYGIKREEFYGQKYWRIAGYYIGDGYHCDIKIKDKIIKNKKWYTECAKEIIRSLYNVWSFAYFWQFSDHISAEDIKKAKSIACETIDDIFIGALSGKHRELSRI